MNPGFRRVVVDVLLRPNHNLASHRADVHIQDRADRAQHRQYNKYRFASCRWPSAKFGSNARQRPDLRWGSEGGFPTLALQIEGRRRFAISAAATRLDTLRLSRSVARERMWQIMIGPSCRRGRPLRDPNERAVPIKRLSDHWERHADGQLMWKEAPRDASKSVRDLTRWNERYRGKPIDETPGAL